MAPTRLLRELGDGYTAALADHRRIVRETCAAYDGVEVDTQGDAFFLAFARATDAVVAGSEIQRALADGPIRVRMGLHTGEPRLTDEGYVGLDVHKGSRIAAVGQGGQVLLSQSTRALWMLWRVTADRTVSRTSAPQSTSTSSRSTACRRTSRC